MRCNAWERYDLVTHYNRGFQFCDIVLMYRIWSSQNARVFFFLNLLALGYGPQQENL